MFEALLILAAASQTPDPLAPAREGKVQCFLGDAAAKKCLAIGRYEAKDGGKWQTTSVLLLAPSPLITMEVSSEAVVEGDAVCGPLRREDFVAAKVMMNGAPMAAEQAAPIVQQVTAMSEPMFGKKACTKSRAEGEVFVAETTLDGVARPDLTQRYIWVKPEDGYAVGG